MIARKPHSQIGPDDRTIVNLQFVAGATIHKIDAEMTSPVVTPMGVVETLDRIRNRIDVTGDRRQPVVVCVGIILGGGQKLNHASQ